MGLGNDALENSLGIGLGNKSKDLDPSLIHPSHLNHSFIYFLFPPLISHLTKAPGGKKDPGCVYSLVVDLLNF
jgi:hypothetical protein